MARRKSLTAKVKTRDRVNSILMLIASSMIVWLLAIFFARLTSPLTVAAQNAFMEQAAANGLADFALAILFAVIVIYFFRRKKIFGTLVSLILAFLIFAGSSLYFGFEAGFFLAAGLLLWERMHRSFLSNNIYVLVAVLFGAIPLGITYPVELIILALILISIYDVFGVFFTRFIPRLAVQATELQVPLLMLAPRATVKWTARPKLRDASAILGAGDIFLPAITLASVSFHQSVPVALTVFLGAIIGGLANTALAAVIRTGIPAMPLLAAGMIAAYYLAL